MKKKKILILCGSLKIGGAEKVAQSIALLAPDEYFEFHYVTFDSKIGEYESPLLDKGCIIHHMMEPSQNYILFFRELNSLLKNEHFQVVHAHTMFNCGWIMFFAMFNRVPIRISHAHSSLKVKKSFGRSVYEFVMRFLIITCSTELVACGMQAGCRLFGTTKFKKYGKLIYNGIVIEDFSFQKDTRKRIRNLLKIDESFVIGHVGHLSEVKNQSFLLNLMPLINSKFPNAKLLLLGDGEDRTALNQLAITLGVNKSVIFAGNVNNVNEYLSAMDVFVFPSLYEGMPLSLLEVQANGLPCIVSDSIPTDVFLTDLIRPLSLHADPMIWVEEIIAAKRINSVHYKDVLQHSVYSAESFVKQILSLYK